MGSNIRPAENIRSALHELAGQFDKLRISTVYRTPAEGDRGQPDFYNCVAGIETKIAPQDLKYQVLRPIETALERNRAFDKNAPRTIDLDLILYGEVVLDTNGLILPDPDIFRRSFLSIPLAELEPELIIPGIRARITEIAAAFGTDAIRPLHEYTELLRKELSK
jgi:2-amino-4-hydroxy-6-hydroxymethyldihydropteridine diphosphokinase